MECEQSTGFFRVIARKDRTAVYQQAQGVLYLSLEEIENCLVRFHIMIVYLYAYIIPSYFASIVYNKHTTPTICERRA